MENFTCPALVTSIPENEYSRTIKHGIRIAALIFWFATGESARATESWALVRFSRIGKRKVTFRRPNQYTILSKNLCDPETRLAIMASVDQSSSATSSGGSEYSNVNFPADLQKATRAADRTHIDADHIRKPASFSDKNSPVIVFAAQESPSSFTACISDPNSSQLSDVVASMSPEPQSLIQSAQITDKYELKLDVNIARAIPAERLSITADNLGPSVSEIVYAPIGFEPIIERTPEKPTAIKKLEVLPKHSKYWRWALLIAIVLGLGAGAVLVAIVAFKTIDEYDGSAIFFLSNEARNNGAEAIDAIRMILLSHKFVDGSFSLTRTKEGNMALRFLSSKLPMGAIQLFGWAIQDGSPEINSNIRYFEYKSDDGLSLFQACPPTNDVDPLCNFQRPINGCPEGRVGADCSECDRVHFGPLCSPCPMCETNFRCSSSKEGTGKCVCKSGRTGERCDACSLNFFGSECNACPDCGIHGICNDGINATGQCRCAEGWTGTNCEHCNDVAVDGSCQACDCGTHGICSRDGSCECRQGWAGIACDVCAPMFYGLLCEPCPMCSFHGMCYDGQNGDGSCICWPGYSGDSCEVSPVGNGGSGSATVSGRSQLNYCGPGNAVALTFDDGPHELRTPVVLRELAALGIRATFFISPANRSPVPSATQCALVREAIVAGHDIQSHTFHHRDLRTLSDAEVRDELASVWNWVQQCLGASAGRIAFNQMRPPFGSATGAIVSIANEMGYTVSTWNLDTFDYRQEGMDAVMTRIENGFVEGSTVNILMHDHSYESGLLSRVIAFYRSRGVARYVTMSECLKMCSPNNCRDRSRNGYSFFI